MFRVLAIPQGSRQKASLTPWSLILVVEERVGTTDNKQVNTEVRKSQDMKYTIKKIEPVDREHRGRGDFRGGGSGKLSLRNDKG